MFATILRNRFAHIRPVAILRQNYYYTTESLPRFAAIQSPNPTTFKNAIINHVYQPSRHYSVDACNELDPLRFNEVCCETLESLCDYFEEIVESNSHFKNSDVVYGVLLILIDFLYNIFIF